MSAQRFDDSQRLASAKVIVVVDRSDGSWTVVRWAARFAADRGRDLEIVHGMGLVGTGWVLGDYEVVVPSVIDAVREQGKDVIARAEHLAGQTSAAIPTTAASTHSGAWRMLGAVLQPEYRCGCRTDRARHRAAGHEFRVRPHLRESVAGGSDPVRHAVGA